MRNGCLTMRTHWRQPISAYRRLLKKRVIKSALDTYTGAKVDDKEVRKFVAYLDRFVRQTSSKNDINYRISSLYNYIVSKYSDYMEINEIVLNEN